MRVSNVVPGRYFAPGDAVVSRKSVTPVKKGRDGTALTARQRCRRPGAPVRSLCSCIPKIPMSADSETVKADFLEAAEKVCKRTK